MQIKEKLIMNQSIYKKENDWNCILNSSKDYL